MRILLSTPFEAFLVGGEEVLAVNRNKCECLNEKSDGEHLHKARCFENSIAKLGRKDNLKVVINMTNSNAHQVD